MKIIFSKYKHTLLIDDEDYHLIEGKKLHLWKSSPNGTYYDELSRKHHGEFAYQNPI